MITLSFLVALLVLLCVVGRRLWNQSNERDDWHPEDWE